MFFKISSINSNLIFEIQKQLDKLYGNITLLYVCGMDHYIKCARGLGKNVIAIDRKPFKQGFGHDNLMEDHDRMIFLIRDDKSEPYSSTSIRDYYKKGDFENIKKSTFPDVFNMIIEFYDQNKNSFVKNFNYK